MKKYLLLIAMSAALLTGCKNDDSGTTEQPTDAPEIEVGVQTPQPFRPRVEPSRWPMKS